MKVCICGDVHWSEFSSIIRKQGNKYSSRLENLINSVSWVESLAEKNNCDLIVYLGDFFDKAELNSPEITALNEIKWSSKSKKFIVGNHEMYSTDLILNSANILNLSAKAEIITQPRIIEDSDTNFYFLPYILEAQRKPFSEYVQKSSKINIVFAHSDIAGIQMGRFKSDVGFSVEEISDSCDLFINGHLHNGTEISSKIINVGNITGQNFSEDAFNYEHHAIVLDTQQKSLQYYENPYAFNFYKLDFRNITLEEIHNCLSKLKPNAVVSINIMQDKLEKVKQLVKENNNISESRITINLLSENTINSSVELVQVDHIQKFNEFVLQTLGNNYIVQDELKSICLN